MAVSNPTWIGADNDIAPDNNAEERELFLKVFAGEVVTAFEKHTIMLDKHNVRTISSGKSASFPIIGRMPDAAYHTPGAEIDGQDILNSEIVVSIDALLISHVFIDSLQDAMNHFDVRSKYSGMMGRKLAETFDNHVMREVGLGAQASATVSTLDGGLETTDTDLDHGTAATKWGAWEDCLFAAAVNFDNKFVPREGRYCVMVPSDYYFLVRYMGTNGMSMIQRDVGGEGSYADGSVVRVGGLNLISTPMLPVNNDSGDDYHNIDTQYAKYIAFGMDAVATVKLLDLSLQSQWDIRRQGDLIVARYAMGHSYLRPESCVLGITQ